jgi:hypothetical protein
MLTWNEEEGIFAAFSLLDSDEDPFANRSVAPIEEKRAAAKLKAGIAVLIKADEPKAFKARGPATLCMAVGVIIL